MELMSTIQMLNRPGTASRSNGDEFLGEDGRPLTRAFIPPIIP